MYLDYQLTGKTNLNNLIFKINKGKGCIEIGTSQIIRNLALLIIFKQYNSDRDIKG